MFVETSVSSAFGVDGRSRFRYSAVNWGGVGNDLHNASVLCFDDDEIFVSTQGLRASELSLLSCRQMS